MSSINRSRLDPVARFSNQNSVRKRVFYNGNANQKPKMNPVYSNRLQGGTNITTPIHVQAVGKNDIQEMEASGTSRPVKEQT